jgi:hypothetical protein
MSLTTAFPELCLRLRQLRDVLDGLRLTVVEDKPLQGGDVALVDHRTDTIEDVLGLIEEGLDAAERGRRALSRPGEIDAVATARDALITCQATFNAVTRRFQSDLVSYDRVAEVAGLGRARGGEWRGWAASVRQALRRCEEPAAAVTESLFACWRELAEQAGGPAQTVTVCTTSIGQQVVKAAPMDSAKSGV